MRQGLAIDGLGGLLRNPYRARSVGSGGDGHFDLLDGMRAIAAMAVLLFHYRHFFFRGPAIELPVGAEQSMPWSAELGPIYAYGNFAVQFFWLLSGFIFSYTYYRTAGTARSFAVNRLARLYPLHLLTLVIVAVLQWAALERFGHWLIYDRNTLDRFVLQLAFVEWSADGHAFNGPIWSVSVELVVYLAFWTTRNWMPRYGVLGPALTAAVALGWMALFGHNVFVACAFYFFAGCGIAIASEALGRSIGKPVLGIAGLTAGVGVVVWWPGDAAAYVGLPLATAGLIFLAHWYEGRAGSALRAASRYLGDCTYGIYLWHVPLQIALLVALGPAFDVAGMATQGWFLLAYLAVVVLTARASFQLVERPARKWVRQHFSPSGKV